MKLLRKRLCKSKIVNLAKFQTVFKTNPTQRRCAPYYLETNEPCYDLKLPRVTELVDQKDPVLTKNAKKRFLKKSILNYVSDAPFQYMYVLRIHPRSHFYIQIIIKCPCLYVTIDFIFFSTYVQPPSPSMAPRASTQVQIIILTVADASTNHNIDIFEE